MKYNCEIDGREGGIWTKKETPKTITFTYVDDLHFKPNYTIIKVKKETRNDKKGDIRYHGYGNVLIDWEDGTYTAYPNQTGISYYFISVLCEKNKD